MYQLPLPIDILRYVISEYLSYDELQQLRRCVAHLRCNPHRTTTRTTVQEYTYRSSTLHKFTLVDGLVRREDEYTNGAIHLRKKFNTAGRLHGASRYYHPNGYRAELQHYCDGVQVGIERVWYPNGVLREECNWANDLYHGPRRNWYSNGVLQGKYGYCNGELHGIVQIRYSDGVLHIQYNYIHGRMHGTQRIWHPNGAIAHEWHYDMNRVTSARHWDERGASDGYNYMPLHLDHFEVNYYDN